uniref:calcium-binding protein n=1 Tax=Kiloniella sp. GXU_MW_B19 TaxID=3141326 RepID=UPI0031CE747A
EDYQEAYTAYRTWTSTYTYGQDDKKGTRTHREAYTAYRTATREVHGDGGSDVLAFGAGITAADILVRQDGADLVVALKDPSNADAAFEALSDRIRLKNWTEEKDRIETFRFEDGSELTVSGIVSAVGTAGADVLTWSETAVDADLGAGNDTATTGSEADTLSGGAGDDTLDAGAGDDRLIGGTGNDTLIGGSGTDTYVYALGDGQDVIRNTDVAGRVELGAGIAADDVVFVRIGDDLIARLPQDGRITVEGYFSSDAQKVSFALSDGSDLSVVAYTSGTDSADTITGTDVSDRIVALGGADTVHAGSGADIVFGDGGEDVLHGGAGADTLSGGADNDRLYGEADNDRLIGNAGSDELYGGSGDDVYVFGRGDGSDLVHDEHRYSEDYQEAYTAYRTWTSTYTYGQDDKKGTRTHREAYTAYRTATREVHGDGGSDVLAFGAGITAADILIRQDGSDLVVALKDPINADAAFEALSDRIRLKNWTEEKDRIETFRFEDGSEFNVSVVNVSSAGVSDGADIVFGTAGTDTLQGGSGDDLLIGGAGNDQLSGDAGEDTYIFDTASGQDTIQRQATSGSDEDTILFDNGVRHDQLWFEKAGDDLLIKVLDSDATVTVEDWYDSTYDRAVADIRTSDGAVLMQNSVDQLVSAMSSFASDQGQEDVGSSADVPGVQTILTQHWDTSR